MQIDEYNVPGLCAGEIEIAEMTWHQRFVVCIACDESMEKLIIEFENEFFAGDLRMLLKPALPKYSSRRIFL
jgi:hypothetical protein